MSNKRKKNRRRELGATVIWISRKGKRTCRRIRPNGPANNRIHVRDVLQCADICGSKWFTPNNMRFFKTRLSETAYADRHGGAFFVSSEKGPGMARAYSVRHFRPGSRGKCSVDTVGEFQQYKTGAAAHRAAQAASKPARRARASRA